MRHLWTAFLTLTLATTASAEGLTLSASTVAGFDTNPAAYSDGDPQGMGWSRLTVGWERPSDDADLSVSYVGSFYSFVPNTDWTAHQHGGKLTYSGSVTSDIVMGFDGALAYNLNRPAYEAFDFRELSGGLFVTAASAWPARASISFASRAYPDSPEFDYGQLDVEGSVSHSFPTRTSIKLSGEIASREYSNVTYVDLLSGDENPTSRRWQLSARVGQNLTSTLGLKVTGWIAAGQGRSRWRDDYWQIMDDPLANSGFGGTGQVSWLGPLGITFRGYTNAERREESYVDSEGYDALRIDKLARVGVAMEGALPWLAAGRAFMWTADVGATLQRSDDPLYSYDRFSTMLGLAYRW